MFKYLILIFLSLSILIVSCDSNKPEEVKKDEKVNQEATDNFDSLVEESTETKADSTTQTMNDDTLKSQPESSTSASDAYSQKPLEAEIIALSDIGSGNFRKLNKDLAKQLVANGEILAVKAGDIIYFVYNEDGTLASKKLAGYANNSKVLMTGKAKLINDVNIFIVNLMEGK